ncbi:uncharacterized protein LOC120251720 [Dioscorea cayenensis subsp. rotundata]|uniref:Uncharacterized protein LOC120251720 n=1 Tax=Dioscorea cayennensis subsp. rotundata TaxID=55577 RepID=A0AB40AMZ1_DIOCR|nr:uncharacterized protein LOC120251720 [Dioscorea cayenensis subsp. rotundata]
MEELYEPENKEQHRSTAVSFISTTTSKSTAVSVPKTRHRRQFNCNLTDEDEGINDDGKTEMIPPHVLVSRRGKTGNMAFSLCSGHGRTLKGRDLRHVRDSVLRMTGYLEG